jgi:hypothetical protein
MKVSGTTRWITISYTGSSLYSLIADGQHRQTNVGKSTWRSLLPQSSLQANCNKEGLNVRPDQGSSPNLSQARLGIISNEQNDCNSPDNFIGFGTMFKDRKLANSAGNFACCGSDNGDMNIRVMGYILAR